MWVAFANAKSYSHFFSKNISVYAVFNDYSFNDTLTNDMFSFEQLGPKMYTKIMSAEILPSMQSFNIHVHVYCLLVTLFLATTGCPFRSQNNLVFTVNQFMSMSNKKGHPQTVSRQRSDAAQRCIWLGCTLFALSIRIPIIRIILTRLLLNTACHVFANSVAPDQLASEEANWPGSALFVIKYVNFYQKPGSSNLIGWKLEVGVAF